MKSLHHLDKYLRTTGAGGWISGVLAIVILAESGFAFLQYQKVIGEFATLEEESAATALRDNTLIAQLSAELALAKNENSGLSARLLGVEQEKNQIQSQVQGISAQVGILQKLNATDKQLLQKYSKIYFLNENYSPAAVSIVPPQYESNKGDEEKFNAQAYPFLIRMLDAASAANAPLKVVSGYRSFGEQSNLKAAYKTTYGAGTANQFSADQGYSEHQLGTAADLAAATGEALTTSFEKTAAFQWLLGNGYKYGFVLSYPKNNKFYQYEPWHWRFVGVALATKLHADGKYFYDLDQREIDPYLISLFD